MAEHKGWRVRLDKRSGAWRGAVRIAGGYRTKSFSGISAEREARAWARTEASGVTLGRPSPSILAANYVETEGLVAKYRARLVALGRSESYLRDVDLILTSLAAAVPNLASEEAPEKIGDWLLGLKTSGAGRGGKVARLSSARRNKYLVVARALCRWAVRKGALPKDPSAQEDFAQVPRYLKPQFSLDDCRILVGHRHSNSHAWAMLMLYAGLRADEARCLRWTDVDWTGGAILVRLAGGASIKREKERIVPLQSELRAILEPLKAAGGVRIVTLGKGNLQRAFADLLTAAEIAHDGKSPHSCRHTYAGLMTATGVPTTLLRAYLGHESEKTTQGYAQMAARHVGGVTAWKRGEFQLLI